jgi:hypothetical protein
VNFGQRGRHTKKGHSPKHGKNSPKKKKLTDEELRAKLELELKDEEAALEHQRKLGDEAAALQIQSNFRGGAVRDYNEGLAKESGAVTLQSVQRGHSERRHMDPFQYPVDPDSIKDSATRMLEKLNRGIEPMLTLEDRTAVMWETTGYKDPVSEKWRKRGRPVSPGGVYGDNPNGGNWGEERPPSKEDADPNKKVMPWEEKKDADDPNLKKGIHPLGPVRMWPNLSTHVNGFNKNNNPEIPIANQDMLVWLGKAPAHPTLPLDKKLRKKKRDEKVSMFGDFVDQSLALLDDFEDRVKLIKNMDKLKRKVADSKFTPEPRQPPALTRSLLLLRSPSPLRSLRSHTVIYKDEKEFQSCVFEEQVKHE